MIDIDTVRLVLGDIELVAQQVEQDAPALADELRRFRTTEDIRRKRAARDWRIMNAMGISTEVRRRFVKIQHNLESAEIERIALGKDATIIEGGRDLVDALMKHQTFNKYTEYIARKIASPRFTGNSP